MKSAFDTIAKFHLFNFGENIGVACSGGSDSICLLHFLNANKEKFNINVFAINVNHSIRENSNDDTLFVENFCKQNSIPLIKTKVDCIKAKNESNLSSLENVARTLRYEFFNSLLTNKKVDKICLAHHQSDQAETILLNIFRGAGIKGASGMKVVSENYIRPFLNTSKNEILDYIKIHNLSYVTDESNFDTNFNRNYIRELVLPLIENRFPKAKNNITSFGNKCNEDNKFIESFLPKINYFDNVVKIPLEIFSMKKSIYKRIIFKAFENLKVYHNIEEKHLALISDVANKKLNTVELPFDCVCKLENEYLVIYKNLTISNEYPFSTDAINFNNIFCIELKETSPVIQKNHLKFDYSKLPSGLVWRKRKQGDYFTKINGTKQKLKDFLIDRKIPLRNRDIIPVLAKNNEIFICGNIEICDKIKIDKNSKKILEIQINKNFKE